MDKEIVKSMREAIKQGNLDLVKKLNVNNEGLLNVLKTDILILFNYYIKMEPNLM